MSIIKSEVIFSAMKRKIDFLELALIAFMALLVIFTGITGTLDKKLFMVEAVITVLALGFGIFRLFRARKDSRKFLEYVSNRLGAVQHDALRKFPMPVVITDDAGIILWSNEIFHTTVMRDNEGYGLSSNELFEGFDREKAFTPEGCEVTYRNNCYCVFASSSIENGERLYAFYFIDKSKEKLITRIYDESRPAVLSIVLDNLDDLFANCKESERSRIIGEVENLFENFSEENHALIKHYESSKYIAIVEEKYLREMINNRFSILDKARKITTSEELPVTLSIGVAGGDYDLNKLVELSGQALEMALGRGGDQAAVHNLNGYEFYGGFAQGVEKRTKVKTRVVAAALRDIIETSPNVLVMGHRFGDLDCIGAAIAMAEACRDMGKESKIVVRRESCLAKPLLEKTEKAGKLDLFISPEEALPLVIENTLLIIVDTHIRGILESPEIYSACRNVAVIDHHRRMVGNIDNALIFYHEPHASSASEMVAELLQYFGSDCKTTKSEAEALLAGIMLDTKSFSMRSGVRTFEAAAYLRKLGADTVKVKQLFSGSLESYQHRSAIVSAAEIYRGVAISFAADFDDIGLVAPQAADELLTIEGVSASVVMYNTSAGVSFSARSLGGMNVQVIMEALGGGGHQTMAGAQIKDVTKKEAQKLLFDAIDDYYIKAEGHADESLGI